MLQQTSNVFSEARRVLAAALGGATQMRGLVAGTPVATPGGACPVERLRPGDAVIGQDGKPHLLARVERRVLDGRAAQEALAQAVLVPRFLLGNDRPLLALAGQPLLVHVPRARTMLGTDFALLPPRALAGQVDAVPVRARVEVVELFLAEAAAVWVGNTLLAVCAVAGDGGAVDVEPRFPVLDASGAAALVALLARPAVPSPFRAPTAAQPRRVKPAGRRGRRGQAAAGWAP